MKVALIVYHKNALTMYPAAWIEAFKKSIDNQTYKDFQIFELDYGGDGVQIFENSYYESVKMPTFVHAMNYLLDKCYAGGYDCFANVNVDDYFCETRLEKQIQWIAAGIDVVSSNFALVRNDKVVLTHQFHELNIKAELDRDHNVICHPVIMMSRRFWKNNRYVPEEIPFEDMKLWQRGIAAGYNFKILPDILCYHRLHEKSVGHNLKEN